MAAIRAVAEVSPFGTPVAHRGAGSPPLLGDGLRTLAAGTGGQGTCTIAGEGGGPGRTVAGRSIGSGSAGTSPGVIPTRAPGAATSWAWSRGRASTIRSLGRVHQLTRHRILRASGANRWPHGPVSPDHCANGGHVPGHHGAHPWRILPMPLWAPRAAESHRRIHVLRRWTLLPPDALGFLASGTQEREPTRYDVGRGYRMILARLRIGVKADHAAWILHEHTSRHAEDSGAATPGIRRYSCTVVMGRGRALRRLRTAAPLAAAFPTLRPLPNPAFGIQSLLVMRLSHR